jgi:hypothetical protein
MSLFPARREEFLLASSTASTAAPTIDWRDIGTSTAMRNRFAA